MKGSISIVVLSHSISEWPSPQLRHNTVEWATVLAHDIDHCTFLSPTVSKPLSLLILLYHCGRQYFAQRCQHDKFRDVVIISVDCLDTKSNFWAIVCAHLLSCPSSDSVSRGCTDRKNTKQARIYSFAYVNTYLYIYLLAYSMEQSPSWEANWFCS